MKYRYVLYNAAVMATNYNGCSAKAELLEKPNKKRGPAVCKLSGESTRTYGLCVEYMIHIQAAQ